MHIFLAVRSGKFITTQDVVSCSASASPAVLTGSDRHGAKQHWLNTQSYRKEVERRNWAQTGELWMEIDGDKNTYDDERAFDKLFQRHDLAGADDDNSSFRFLMREHSLRHYSPEGALVVVNRDRANASERSWLGHLAHHSMLHASYSRGVLSNFATFALIFESSLQAVDPMIAMPWFDESAELGGHDFRVSTWKERFEAHITKNNADELLRLTNVAPEKTAGGAASSPALNQDIVTEGTWTYVPVITGQQQRQGRDGRKIGVYKGFTMPVMTRAELGG